MTEIRKVPASAGARWLLDGIAIWRRSPLRLAQLGMLFGMTVMLGVALSALNPALGMILQLVIMLLVPVMMGGLIWAVREAEKGGMPRPAHLLAGTHDGRLPHLLLAVLPYFLASIALGMLLLVLVGSDGVQRWQDVQNELNQINASGQTVSPERMYELAATLPVWRFLFWVCASLLTNLAVGLMLALMLPQVMFQQRRGGDALLGSLRAGLANLPAMAVFYACVLVALVAFNLTAFIVLLVLSLILGESLSLVLMLMGYTGIVLPVIAGATYSAWKDLFATGERGPAPPQPPRADGNSGVIEV